MSELVALGNYVLVEFEERAEAIYGKEMQTASGILIAEPEFQGVPNTGTVTAVGGEVRFPKAGDRVLFAAKGDEGFEFEGKKLFRLKAGQVLAVIS